MEHIILVDENDSEVGTMEKMEAHRKGALHRAFSVVLFNTNGEMLLQKRASSKYHSAGLWSNACCSHPKPGEKIEDAAQRRLKEELGIDLMPKSLFKFIYRVAFPNGLFEHEYDHVLVATFNGNPIVNKAEVDEWKFVDYQELKQSIHERPKEFTHWFKIILEKMPSMQGLKSV